MLIPVLPKDLLNISTSDTEPCVLTSVDFLTVCPTNLFGSPDILSTTKTSLRVNSAVEGLSK